MSSDELAQEQPKLTLRIPINRASARAPAKAQSRPSERGEESRSRTRNYQAVNIEISPADKDIAMELGLRKLTGRNVLTDRLYPVATTNKEIDEFQMDDEPATRADDENDWLDDVDGFLNQLSVMEGARKNTSKPSIPGSAHRNKKKGLSEIARSAIATNPAANRREVYRDSRSIQRATRLFTHKPRMDGTGHWKMDGMKSSLYHYQVSP